jgi:hypothetical protein
MNFPQRLVAILSVILACVVVAGCILLAPIANAQDLNSKVPPPELTFNIPFNPKKADKEEYDREKAFGAFAWKAFIALNWPAVSSGCPNKDKMIGQDPDAPRVWEFYNSPEDVFKPKGAQPNLQPVVSPQCLSPGSSQPVVRKLELTEFASNSNLQPDVTRSDASLSPLLDGNVPLVDREGNYILNESRMNHIEFNQIFRNKWYSATKLQGFDNKDKKFMLMCSKNDSDGFYPSTDFGKVPCSDNVDEGTIELKAAWKVFRDPVPPESKSKYYTTKRTFNVTTVNANGGKVEKNVTVPLGLVGFHILHKTSNQGWVWSTFEHKDNAPDANNLSASGNYNLYDSNCSENCETNTPHPPPSFDCTPDGNCKYYWHDEFPHAVNSMNQPQIPSQITRLTSIKDYANDLNKAWQKELNTISNDSVWQNYQLIGVQWLQTPTSPYFRIPGVPLGTRGVLPGKLANVTLEPYVQKTATGSSCIACHTQRTTLRDATLQDTGVHTDFSFFITRAQFP